MRTKKKVIAALAAAAAANTSSALSVPGVVAAANIATTAAQPAYAFYQGEKMKEVVPEPAKSKIVTAATVNEIVNVATLPLVAVPIVGEQVRNFLQYKATSHVLSAGKKRKLTDKQLWEMAKATGINDWDLTSKAKDGEIVNRMLGVKDNEFTRGRYGSVNAIAQVEAGETAVVQGKRKKGGQDGTRKKANLGSNVAGSSTATATPSGKARNQPTAADLEAANILDQPQQRLTIPTSLRPHDQSLDL